MDRDRNVVFAGAIPENYDRYLGPVIFEPYAEDLVSRLKGKKLNRVLEIACGTGIVTRRLRDALAASTEVIATDLNPDMFEFAKRKFKESENVHWQQADALALPFPDESFDAVVCQFGYMFVPDKAAAMRESYRVLRQGGLFLFNVWDSLDANPFAQIAHTTIASFFDHDPPKFYEIPFSLHESRLVRELLRGAGFDKIESFAEMKPCRSQSAREFATGLVRGNPVGTEAAERGVDPEKLIDAVARSLAGRFEAGPVESTMRAIVWQAIKP
ncbi:MAG TPA: class I SAM-dependent methyltransferase [Chthoniobacterales bacterium]|jgi:ubiquinone/menaquinone biosynthesis C-methylase UbiE|nr:class I SAM-dependent methyltransferase [Chthoniobacterales bacterium]